MISCALGDVIEMTVTHERRCGQDRRQLDLPLPNDKERRRLVESRKTMIVEMAISDDEWANYFGGLVGKSESQVSDEAAAIFGRARG